MEDYYTNHIHVRTNETKTAVHSIIHDLDTIRLLFAHEFPTIKLELNNDQQNCSDQTG